MNLSSFLRCWPLLAGLAFVSSPLVAQRGSPQLTHDGESIDAMIAAFMREHDIPGMALAIVQAPYITRVTGHGLSNVETRRLVAANTLFDLGDMAEAYTAVAVMQLVEQGKIALDDRIERHLPATPRAWQGVTVRQLLQHQSGLPDNASVAPAFAPGTHVRASATDHLLLQQLVEAASGGSYERFVRTHQFERLGLRQTLFASELERVAHEKFGPAEKHRRFLQEPALINPTEPATGYPGGVNARTAIHASASDVSLWDIGLAGDILIKDAALRKILYAPASLADGSPTATSGPWWFPGHRGLMIARGSGGGFSALLSRFTDPGELLCVTLLANKEGVDLTQLARRIAGAHDAALGPPRKTERLRVQQSPYSTAVSLDRLEAALRQRGANIIARIDHAKAATAANLSLPATAEIIFGNPAAGTRLMQANPAAAADLPLRVAAWEANGEVWLAGPDPVEIARRNGIEDHAGLALKMRATLDAALLEAVSGER